MTANLKGRLVMRGASLTERFWARVEKCDGCWMWTGARSNYGRISSDDGRTLSAHRTSYEIHFGAIPPNMVVMHRCDVPLCVRPDHLTLGTQQDNLADMRAKGRERGPGRT